MKIALLANTRKNDLLINFAIAYRHILTKHELVSFFFTAKLLEDAVKLEVSSLTGDYVAGIAQLAARALYNEIDVVIYLRDVMASDYDEPNPLQKACDINNIPFASNLAEAEMIVLGIDRGDLDWRELLR